MAVHPHKRRRLSPPNEDPVPLPKKTGFTNAFTSQASSWNLEQNYERRDRKGKKAKKENTRLPIKTAAGVIQQVEPLDEDGDENYDAGINGAGGGENTLDNEAKQDDAREQQYVEEQLPIEVQIIHAQEKLAKIAESLNEEPEENTHQFKHLTRIAQDPESKIQHLALLAQLSIYTDQIPGYRIRPLTEEQLKIKVSTDVRKTRDHEQALVMGYKQYVDSLAALSKSNPSEGSGPLDAVAVSCAMRLLSTVPHFNFRTNLLQIIIDRLFLVKESDPTFLRCIKALEKFFEDDEEGAASLDAMNIIARSLKDANYRAHPALVKTFFKLRLLSELPYRASASGVDKTPSDDLVRHARRMKKKDREFRTKKTRKLLKEQKVIEKEMREADATVSHEERDRCQAETLKIVFALFLRTLKAQTSSLMPVVLEGLGKFAHMINQDFFGDLLEVLKELMVQGSLVTSAGNMVIEEEDTDASATAPEDLLMPVLCIKTAFALLRGQSAPGPGGSKLTDLPLDLSHFTDSLYALLLPAATSADLESSRMYGGPSSTSNPIAPYLLTSLSPLLLQPPRLAPPAATLQKFMKALMTFELQMPEVTSANTMKLLTAVMKMHKPRLMGLWDSEERIAVANRPGESSLALAWESHLLRKHWHPDVRQGWTEIERVARQMK